MSQPVRSGPTSARVAEHGPRALAKKRRRPEQIATRSSMALEAMCFAIVRRLPGLSRVNSVEVLEIVVAAQRTKLGAWRSCDLTVA